MKAGAETVGNIFFSQAFRSVFQRQTVLVKGSGLNFLRGAAFHSFYLPNQETQQYQAMSLTLNVTGSPIG